MLNSKFTLRPSVLALGLVLLAASLFAPSPTEAQAIPSDPQPTCTVTSQQFASWFQSGFVTLNGVVTPADSLDFVDVPNCNFYQWAFQMFLWLTSPAPATYCGGGAHVFDSPAFFDVSPDVNKQRTLISHTCNIPPLKGIIRNLGLRASQVGAHGLPVIISKAGQLLEVEDPPTAPDGKPLVFLPSGVAVEVQSIILKEGKPVFLDKTGKPISAFHPILHTPLLTARLVQTPTTNTRVVQRFMINNRPIFIDPFGNVVEVEQGQANTGGVLMSQTNSLVYFGITVNDVYAYFLTGMKDGFIAPTGGSPGQFPTTPADLAKITAFASAHGVTFPDPKALAVEIKTAWVDATTLPDPNDYITINASIPTYSTSPTQWSPSGSKDTTLALVGMHVVGSTGSGCLIQQNPPVAGQCQGGPPTPGHPEMIWATFEHAGNTPLAQYQYNALTQSNKLVPQDTSGTWLFSSSNSTGPFNCMHMMESNGNIVLPGAGGPCPAGSFTPSDTLRLDPFGAAFNVSPNPIDGSDVASNTEIISIDHSVRPMLLAGDVRANYYLAGATWTIFGAPPDGNQVGTSMLAGSTMETYTEPSNCFLCHISGASTNNLATTDVSHIFSAIQALSFAPLSVRVAQLPDTAFEHKIQVTVTNSGSGAPIAGATVRVIEPGGGGIKATGTTSGAGSATLTYARCFEVVDTRVETPLRPETVPPNAPISTHPIVLPVPCDGSVSATGFPPVGFSAP